MASGGAEDLLRDSTNQLATAISDYKKAAGSARGLSKQPKAKAKASATTPVAAAAKEEPAAGVIKS